MFNDQQTGFNVDSLGFVTNSPYTNAPNIKIAGFEPIGQTPPEGRNDITGHIDEALSWSLGKHQFRFGGEYPPGADRRVLSAALHRHLQLHRQLRGLGAPSAATAAAMPAALADFLGGYLASASIARGNAERQVFINTFDLFAQDSWQLTPTLNFNYGVRYDYVQPMHSLYKNLSVFRPELTASAGLAFQGNQISEVYPSDWMNFSPRVGFSYAPAMWKGTVLRGGFGMFFDTPNANPFLDNRPGNNAPNGLEGNPGGADPVFTVAATPQAGVPSIIPGQPILPSGTVVCNPVEPVRRLLRQSQLPHALQLQLQPANRAVARLQGDVPDWLRRQRGPPVCSACSTSISRPLVDRPPMSTSAVRPTWRPRTALHLLVPAIR